MLWKKESKSIGCQKIPLQNAAACTESNKQDFKIIFKILSLMCHILMNQRISIQIVN